jgi:hypothetical protein
VGALSHPAAETNAPQGWGTHSFFGSSMTTSRKRFAYVTMSVMSSAVESAVHHYIIILFALCALGTLVVSFVRRPVSPEKAAKWPETEGTIQSIGKVVVNAGRSSYQVDVGDFSYIVNDEYYSGRLTLSRPNDGRLAVCRPFTSDGSPKDLVNQKIQVRYDPRKPEKYSVPPQELGGILLDPYDEPLGQDIGLIDLNIDKG